MATPAKDTEKPAKPNARLVNPTTSPMVYSTAGHVLGGGEAVPVVRNDLDEVAKEAISKDFLALTDLPDGEA